MFFIFGVILHASRGMSHDVYIPFLVTGIDCDNGGEFIYHDLVGWAGQRDVFFTRSRPYKKNDQATIESKNNHLVRRYGFYHRYDTKLELELLNQLWTLVCDRLNFFTPTKKPLGWSTDTVGRRKRVYDKPRSPYQRLLDTVSCVRDRVAFRGLNQTTLWGSG